MAIQAMSNAAARLTLTSVRAPSVSRFHHALSGPCAYDHPSTAPYAQFFPALQGRCKQGGGLLRSWIIKSEKEAVSKHTEVVFAKFMDRLSRDPFFGKAVLTTPRPLTVSSEALYDYLRKVQEARALIILAGYSDLFNSCPFVDRSDPLKMLPPEVQLAIAFGNLDLLGQAEALRKWITIYDTFIRECGTSSIEYSDPALPIGILPKEVASWPLLYVTLEDQQLQFFPTCLYPLLPQIKFISLAGNPIACIPRELNTLNPKAKIIFSEESIQKIEADLTHPAIKGCEPIQKAAERLSVLT